jgi:hypothetical protein
VTPANIDRFRPHWPSKIIHILRLGRYDHARPDTISQWLTEIGLMEPRIDGGVESNGEVIGRVAVVHAGARRLTIIKG